MSDTKEWKVELKDFDALVMLFKGLPEKNIAFAFTGKPFPIRVHVLQSKGKATIREIEEILYDRRIAKRAD
jgi:hypothetical protein